MYLLDTDWILQALAHREPASRTLYHLPNGQVHLSIVSVGELYEGAFVFANPQAHLAGFRHFLSAYPMLPLTDPIMERFAEIRSFLRRQGQIVGDFDILIAATAIQYQSVSYTHLRAHETVLDL